MKSKIAVNNNYIFQLILHYSIESLYTKLNKIINFVFFYTFTETLLNHLHQLNRKLFQHKRHMQIMI